MSAPPPETPARIVDLIAAYRQARYDVTLPDHSASTVRIGSAPPAGVAAWIGANGFAAYLTACNPRSVSSSAAQNEARMTHLRRRLRALGARWLDGCAAARDDAWVEPSLLVADVRLRQIDALATAFEQNATVHVDALRPARLRIHRPDWGGYLSALPDADCADP